MEGKKASELKILKGGRDEENLSGIGADTFKWAKATDTRLMGVIGIKVCWRLDSGDFFYQFFHLDSESYGIDGYESLINPNSYEIDYISRHMMGGLGGSFKTISYGELIYLLKWFYALNLKRDEPLPEGFAEFEKLIEEPLFFSEKDEKDLMRKICEKITGEAQCIHYYLMRLYGGDFTAADYLMDTIHEDNLRNGLASGTLLRDKVTCYKKARKGRVCRSESLTDTDSGYRIAHCELNVVRTAEGYRIREARKVEEMRVTNIEAAFLLKKPEYLLIYDIVALEEFLMIFKIENPCMMSNMHEAGVLFTDFNKDNSHVEKDIYYLSEDVHSVYYITRAEQLVVASFEEDRSDEAQRMLSGNEYHDMIVMNEELIVDEPVFYEFVNSGEDDIYNFFDSNGIG